MIIPYELRKLWNKFATVREPRLVIIVTHFETLILRDTEYT